MDVVPDRPLEMRDTQEKTSDSGAETQEKRIPVVQIWELKKVYRTGFWFDRLIESLKSITLTVYEGETFGLLGPNGAGKTTLLKILLGFVRRTSGRATLLGNPIGDRATRQHIGYLPENPYLYDYLTAWEFLQYAADLFGISQKVQKQRLPELLDWVELDTYTAKKKPMRQYSKGMLQRVGMAQALVNNPDILFLDEPMSGLDPTGRYRIREIILSLKKHGKTIFFNSHILADVEQICDRIAILDRGELLCTGSLDELLGSGDRYRVTGQGGNAEDLQSYLKELDFGRSGWHGELEGDPQEFLSQLKAMDAHLIGMNLARPSLEEFFLQTLKQSSTTNNK
ncbi:MULTISPECIES: ABC transporter ATP-binding protein [Spirulina sp. CCY15215]|uniref:ABC transporter ATP-binding protein n=1 Tax=Spirulina sp. CCY15215 TaxID=2767591 RepID=UPI001EF3D35F|nr:ABC transporter ATP-binding protein [Spirulina major]